MVGLKITEYVRSYSLKITKSCESFALEFFVYRVLLVKIVVTFDFLVLMMLCSVAVIPKCSAITSLIT